jgi:hypothetical protein
MMSQRTTNRRRLAVERAVKASQLKRAAVDTHLNTRALAGETIAPSTFTVVNTPELSQARGY